MRFHLPVAALLIQFLSVTGARAAERTVEIEVNGVTALALSH